MTEVNKGIRIINFTIDYIVISIIAGLVTKIAGLNPTQTFLICYFFYYFIFETVNGRTFGKIITKTCSK